jgi:hypothetical protein
MIWQNYPAFQAIVSTSQANACVSQGILKAKWIVRFQSTFVKPEQFRLVNDCKLKFLRLVHTSNFAAIFCYRRMRMSKAATNVKVKIATKIAQVVWRRYLLELVLCSRFLVTEFWQNNPPTPLFRIYICLFWAYASLWCLPRVNAWDVTNSKMPMLVEKCCNCLLCKAWVCTLPECLIFVFVHYSQVKKVTYLLLMVVGKYLITGIL